MGQGKEGIVEQELQQATGARLQLWLLSCTAKSLLEIQAPLAKDVSARGWHQLSDEQKVNTLPELVNIIDYGQHISHGTFVAGGLSPETARALGASMTNYYEALPFSRPEHRWLARVADRSRRRGIWGDDATGTALARLAYIEQQRGKIVSLGRRQEVSGDDLMQRLWDWRRGAGEFQRGGTYSRIAAEALKRTVELTQGMKRPGY